MPAPWAAVSAGVRTYGYIDSAGAEQTVSFVGEDIHGSVSVDRCTWIEFGMAMRVAFGAAHGVIYVLHSGRSGNRAKRAAGVPAFSLACWALRA